MTRQIVKPGDRLIARTATLLLSVLFLSWGSAAVLAHPHVWVTVRSQVAFSPDGKVSAIIHDWVFDEMYSSFATQGLAKPGELQPFTPLAGFEVSRAPAFVAAA